MSLPAGWWSQINIEKGVGAHLLVILGNLWFMRHCEERSDVAISSSPLPDLWDCRASLAMTGEEGRGAGVSLINQRFLGVKCALIYASLRGTKWRGNLQVTDSIVWDCRASLAMTPRLFATIIPPAVTCRYRASKAMAGQRWLIVTRKVNMPENNQSWIRDTWFISITILADLG